MSPPLTSCCSSQLLHDLLDRLHHFRREVDEERVEDRADEDAYQVHGPRDEHHRNSHDPQPLPAIRNAAEDFDGDAVRRVNFVVLVHPLEVLRHQIHRDKEPADVDDAKNHESCSEVVLHDIPICRIFKAFFRMKERLH